MLHSRILFVGPALFALAAVACTAEMAPSESSSNESQASSSNRNKWDQCGGKGYSGSTACTNSKCTYSNANYSECVPPSTASGGSAGSCPSGTSAPQQLGAATAAYQIMRDAAGACGSASAGPCWASTILASQRYSVAAAGAVVASETWQTIQFDPTDPQYSYVPQSAKAALAVAQLDSTVAAFLVAGLQWDQANTNGTLFPSMEPIAALSSFTYPGTTTPIVIQDPAAGNNRRTEVVTGSTWCGSVNVHFADTSSYETGFAPFNTLSYQNFYGTTKPAYKGSNSYPSTPFNGSGGANPFLVVSVNGVALSWNTATWPVQNCPSDASCAGTIDIDPIPYTQPAAYYDTSGNLVGPEANPFALVITNLYADPGHVGQWATRTVSGVQQWGTFSTAVTVLGSTVYLYVKQM
jgi:hypothetical protein